MTALLDFAIAFTRAWVATYTRGLLGDVGAERREEIDCDLWHQHRLVELDRQPVTRTAIEILERAILGIPADILWRIETGSATTTNRSTSLNDTLLMRIGLATVSLLLAFLVVNGIGTAFFGGGDFENSTDRALWSIGFLGCPLVTLIGLWLCRERPRIGLGMVVIGALSNALMMYWMLFITVPIALAVIVFAIKRSGLSIWPFRGPSASATGSA